ncbi:MAG: NAD(P)-dependent alcohol dehydrogenase [Spirochaetales bacterium]
MKVAHMTDIKKGKMANVEYPDMKDDEVIVKVKAVGICGSDLHLYANGRSGSYIVPFPYILGHEASGEVVEVGKDVTDLAVGDRVTMEPGKTCGKCCFCKEGKYNLCEDVIFFSAPPYNGVLCEYVSHKADLCFKIADDISYAEGALIEPLAVGYHAARQANAKPGQTAVVIGLGCIGIMTIHALKVAGVDKIFAIDVAEKKLEFAKNLGAYTVNPKDVDAVKAMYSQTEGLGADIVIETAGSVPTTSITHEYAKRGGVIVLVGMIDKDIPYNFFEFICKELTIKSVFRYRNLYKQAIDAVENGRINLKDMITHRFEFENTFKALDFVLENKLDVLKAVIEM